uniref:Tyr recombinase domain-containing protein n=1 Tax=Panagrolaimus superbus TaxID=310955 RepID=A0A914YFT3_9BILA
MIKGIMRIKPKNQKSAEIWDVEEALQWIRKMWPLKDLNLKLLTWRTLLLASLCSPKRSNELAALSLLELRQSSSLWKFTLVRTKNRGYGAPHSAVYHKFEDEVLCPLTSFNAYLEATSAVRKDKEIFLSYIKPYKKVTSATIARWLKSALGEAGIEGYSAHSTRAAATSKAAVKGLTPKTILEAANWSPKSSTFQRFYNKDIDESFQEMILGKSRNDYGGGDKPDKKSYSRYEPKRQTDRARRQGTSSAPIPTKKRR